MPYFNYSLHAADAAGASFLQRRAFLHSWWAVARDDDRWTPPRYTALRRELDPRRNTHLARLRAEMLHVEALRRTGLRRSRTDQQEIPLVSVLERPLAAAVAVIDPRRHDATAHLVWPALADDDEALDRLLDHLEETLAAERVGRLIAPTGLSPHLGSGALVDAWDEWPPQHTPANPPYLPELLERRLQPFRQGRLFHVPVGDDHAGMGGPAVLRPLDPARLAGDLLPLLVAATENPAGFPPPDAAEAAFLLRQAGPRAFGALAEIDGAPVGFVLLAPDEAGRLRAAQGGRPWWGRAALALISSRPTHAGRLLFGAVAPAWRGRGVGRQLWGWALAAAGGWGWRAFTFGPVWWSAQRAAGPPPAASFLAGRGATARQTYRLYELSF